jgi:hypothetical protein
MLALVLVAAATLAACETVETAAPPAKRHFTRMAPIADDVPAARSAGVKTQKVAYAAPAHSGGKTRETTVTAPTSAATPPSSEIAPSKPAPEPSAPPAPDTSASASVATPAAPSEPVAPPVAEETVPATGETATADTSSAPAPAEPAAQPDIVADSSTVAATPTNDPAPAAGEPSLFDLDALMKMEIAGFPVWLAGIVGLALIGALAVGMSGGRKPRDPYGRNEREPKAEEREDELDDVEAEPEPA